MGHGTVALKVGARRLPHRFYGNDAVVTDHCRAINAPETEEQDREEGNTGGNHMAITTDSVTLGSPVS